ncbi:MAG: ubiquinol-cytochrome c reductase iron-sulfur subunit [Deltaproteobacteria bacterium]|nr:ubiquinol-cytochrome c reductase iron-sulfur subunit [Deltaproteobacteria bacterium]
MKLKYSLITRRTFLNTLFGGWLLAFLSGTLYALLRFAFPTLGKEPDFVVLDRKAFAGIAPNSVKRFAWGGTVGLYLKRADGTVLALKGVCSHMECNVDYKPAEQRFYCACHQGWFDDSGKNIAGPPPKPLELFVISEAGDKLIIAKKGVKVELPKA